MRKSLFIVIIIILTTGCQSNNVKSNKNIKKELVNYIENDINSLESIEKEIISTFNTLESNKKSVLEVIASLEKDIIPNYTSFYNMLCSINPQNKEIAAAHNYYKTAAKYQLDAFNSYLEGLKNSDYEKITKVNIFVDSAKEYISMYKKELIKIANKYEIKYTLTP